MYTDSLRNHRENTDENLELAHRLWENYYELIPNSYRNCPSTGCTAERNGTQRNATEH